MTAVSIPRTKLEQRHRDSAATALGTQFEMKMKPPRQAQEWSYSSHRKSIGKALSSPGIRSNKKTHISCGSSARMAGNVCVCECGSNTTPRPMEQHNDKRRISHQPSKRIGAINGRLPHIWSILLSCDHDVQEDFYTRLGAHDGTPPLLLYPIWQHSIFSDPAYLSFKRDMLQIEAQELDPAHALLQQWVPMHSGFQPPIVYKIMFLPALLFCSFFPSSLLFCLHCHSLHSTTSNERTTEQTNERTLSRLCLPPFTYFLQQFSHSHYNSLLPLDIGLTTTPNIACTIALSPIPSIKPT
ncbi:hypothetical protein [Absidia glauca]|uniref:Ndc10 domain-containing protein n=1 Tax=Absidia glauca TaxID=4829 RepID=A0A168S6X2_ABSGL|nr:hypothetical protein [Absidia glauca]